jgi:hypothetical protein
MVERFPDVYLAGWGFPLAIHEGAKANMRDWLGLPGWHLYLAEIDTQAAAIAISFLHENVATLLTHACTRTFVVVDSNPLCWRSTKETQPD